MNTIKNRIEEIKRQGYNFDFGVTFNHAFEIYKKIAAMAGLAFLMFAILLFIVASIYIGTSIDWQNISQNPEEFQLTNFSTVGIISYAVAMILFTAISVPLSAGFIKMCYDADKGQEITIGTAFRYYAGHYFVDLFMAGLLLGSFNIGMSILFEFIDYAWLGTVITVVVGIFAILFVPMIVLGNLRPIEAIRASLIVVSKEFLMIFLMMAIAYLIAFCGILACCVGLFFTMPVLYAVQYSLYIHSVGIEENPETGDFN